MTTDRSYRRALSVSAALEELEACSGSQFDPDACAALVNVIRRGRASVDREIELVTAA